MTEEGERLALRGERAAIEADHAVLWRETRALETTGDRDARHAHAERLAAHHRRVARYHQALEDFHDRYGPLGV